MKMIYKQRGFSLAEALLVVVIGATIIAMTIRLLTQNTFTSKIAQVDATIQTLTNASYTWLQAQNQLDFNGGAACASSGGANEINMQKLYDAGLITFNCPTTGVCSVNPWGGTVRVEHYSNPYTPSTCDSQYVMITYTNVPLLACRSLVNRMALLSYKDQTQAAQCTQNGSYFIAL
jgi:type II secretory pathway pseudopilin PulG